MQRETILILGAGGQIGTELTMELRKAHGGANVVASDIRAAAPIVMESGPFETIDVSDPKRIAEVMDQYKVTQVYHLVALLSATSERIGVPAWHLNMNSLFEVMELCVSRGVKKLFWPSSIAVFGPTTPKANVPQQTVIEPTTIYGMSKYAGELWCDYFFKKKGLDVRSIRYPGLIGYKSAPGGGTTDYAVEIFYAAKQTKQYTCFLNAESRLPMMYMPDAIRATLQLMDAPADKLSIRHSYNITGIDFTPAELAIAIQQEIPDFTIDYKPDFRQAIADSWPGSIDGSWAKNDWGWVPQYDLKGMVKDMLLNIQVPASV